MKNWLLVSLLVSYLLTPIFVFADQITDKQNEITELEKKVAALQSQSKTLSEQIATYDWQIQLAQLKISQSEDQIASVSARISTLEEKLRDRSKLLEQQIVQAYKQGASDYLQILFGPNKVSQLIAKFKYDQIVQTQNRKFLYETQMVQTSYSEQKVLIEQAKKKLLIQKNLLNSYRVERDNLLRQTKNNEANYQRLLNQAREELEAITAVLAGRGNEIEIGNVNSGAKIATVISGASCNSEGSHLHFIVKNDDNVDNPFNYLKSVDYKNCSGSSCGSSDGDAFNPRGSWDWPLNPSITLNQGYGSTWATRYTWVRRIYSFHNGIDISGSSPDVKAVQSGILFRGSFMGSNCRLPYVRIQHKDSNINTYYLHVL